MHQYQRRLLWTVSVVDIFYSLTSWLELLPLIRLREEIQITSLASERVVWLLLMHVRHQTVGKLCVCVCVREREREGEKNIPPPRKKEKESKNKTMIVATEWKHGTSTTCKDVLNTKRKINKLLPDGGDTES